MGRKDEIKCAIKDELMGHFSSTGAKAGDVLSPGWLYNEYLVTLALMKKKSLRQL